MVVSNNSEFSEEGQGFDEIQNPSASAQSSNVDRMVVPNSQSLPREGFPHIQNTYSSISPFMPHQSFNNNRIPVSNSEFSAREELVNIQNLSASASASVFAPYQPMVVPNSNFSAGEGFAHLQNHLASIQYQPFNTNLTVVPNSEFSAREEFVHIQDPSTSTPYQHFNPNRMVVPNSEFSAGEGFAHNQNPSASRPYQPFNTDRILASNSGFSAGEGFAHIRNTSASSLASASAPYQSFHSGNRFSSNEYFMTGQTGGFQPTKPPSPQEFYERTLNPAPSATNHNSQPFIQSTISGQNAGKMKAEHVPISMLQIGNFTKISLRGEDLVAKCYFARKKLIWELLEGNIKKKIEFKWENILSMQVNLMENNAGSLVIELKDPPSFFHEKATQARKHTNWEPSADFTGNQASMYRLHELVFSDSSLPNKIYDKLIQSDERLKELSRGPCPTLPNRPCFDGDGSSTCTPPPLLPTSSHPYFVSNSTHDARGSLPHLPSDGYHALSSNNHDDAHKSLLNHHFQNGSNGCDAYGSLLNQHFPSNMYDAQGSTLDQPNPQFSSNGYDANGFNGYGAHGSMLDLANHQIPSNGYDAHGSTLDQPNPQFSSNGYDANGSNRYNAQGSTLDQPNPQFSSNGYDANGSTPDQPNPQFSSNGYGAHGSMPDLVNRQIPSNGYDAHGSTIDQPNPQFSSNGYDANGPMLDLPTRQFPSNGYDAHGSMLDSQVPYSGHNNVHGSSTSTLAPLQTTHQSGNQMQSPTPGSTISPFHNVVYGQRHGNSNLVVSRDSNLAFSSDSATSSRVDSMSSDNFIAFDLDTNPEAITEEMQIVELKPIR